MPNQLWCSLFLTFKPQARRDLESRLRKFNKANKVNLTSSYNIDTITVMNESRDILWAFVREIKRDRSFVKNFNIIDDPKEMK